MADIVLNVTVPSSTNLPSVSFLVKKMEQQLCSYLVIAFIFEANFYGHNYCNECGLDTVFTGQIHVFHAKLTFSAACISGDFWCNKQIYT